MLHKIKIDSFKLLIPKNQVTYVDPGFCEKYQKLYPDTGYIEEYVNLDKFKVHEKDGIKSRIALFHSKEGKDSQSYIAIQCNSKMAKHLYFEGINKKTAPIIYDYIMGLKTIYTPLENFMYAKATDIDFCYDEEVEPHEMSESITTIVQRVKPSRHKYVGKPFRRKDNVGIQFNKRDKATPAKPFCKIYHKTIELDNHSFDFAKAHLQNIDYSNIGRLEWQMKNSKHRKKLLLRSQTLHDFLNPDKKEFEKIESGLFNAIPKYISKVKLLQDYEELPPQQKMILHFINRDIAKGADKQSIYDSLQIYTNPTERKRMKKVLVKVLEKIDNKHRLVANEKQMDFLRKLRLDF